MQPPRCILFLAIAAAFAIALASAGTVLAESPTRAPMTAVLEGLPLADQEAGQESVTLSARLYGEDGEPAGGEPLVFYVVTTVFGERLMQLGEVLTDATGTASLRYEPTWEGEQTIVVRYGGGGNYEPAQTTFQMNAAGPRHIHENARFGLEGPRKWAPFGVGLVILAVWGALGLVMVRAVLGIPAAAASAESVPAPRQLPKPLRPASLRPVLLLVAVLTLMALPLNWFLSRESGEKVHSSPENSVTADENNLDPQAPLLASLVQSVPAITTDAQGQLTPDSADLPADVAVIDSRVFVLDSNKGRVLTVTKDGALARMFESDRAGERSILRASAMTAHEGDLYIASPLFGNVVVVSPSGRVEEIVNAQIPPGEQPFRPAGIAVTEQGQIWLSDPANHRVLLVDRRGSYLGAIGSDNETFREGGVETPIGLALDGRDNLIVADSGSNQAKKFSPEGVFLAAMGEDQLSSPQAVAVDEAGNVFVTDDELLAVLVYAPDGSYLGSFGRKDSVSDAPSSWLQRPHGVKVDGNLVYVMDRLSGLFVFQIGEGAAWTKKAE